MTPIDLKYNSKILVLGSASVGKGDLIRTIDSYGNKFSDSEDKNGRTSPSNDYCYEELRLPLVDKENVISSEVLFEVYISSNRVNHSLNLKNAYKTAEYIIFVFDICVR